MSETRYKASHIPVNLITGMLGAGKTTLIGRLLEQRPAEQRWAVLVNEFSETGIDGGRLREQGAWVREIAGGCMGCAASVPLRVELNRLIREARPHRLLIEPTGLGHPRELLDILAAAEYQGVLDIRATLCLVDARRLADSAFTCSPLWRQQLSCADMLLGSKQDLWSDQDSVRFDELASIWHAAGRSAHAMAHARADLRWLSLPPSSTALMLPVDKVALAPVLASGRHTEGSFQGHGWVLDPELRFDPAALRAMLAAQSWERIKGHLRTADGGVRMDGVAGELDFQPLSECSENRLQVICRQAPDWRLLEQELLGCIASPR